MKRMHLHMGVPDLAQSIRFYATLFGAPPTVVKHDYAKWMLEDPRVNFAISQRGGAVGVDHVGVQVESAEEATTCCYAKSDKSWVNDPSGVRWETFFTFDDAVSYGEDAPTPAVQASACCGAASKPAVASCC